VSIPWGFLIIGLMLAGLLGTVIWQARKGAVSDYKVREQKRTDELKRVLAEADREVERLDAAARRERLRDKWSRD